MYLVVDKTCQKLPSKSCVVNIVEKQDCGIVSRHVCMLFRKLIAFVHVSYFVIVRHVGCFYGRGRGVAVQVT